MGGPIAPKKINKNLSVPVHVPVVHDGADKETKDTRELRLQRRNDAKAKPNVGNVVNTHPLGKSSTRKSVSLATEQDIHHRIPGTVNETVPSAESAKAASAAKVLKPRIFNHLSRDTNLSDRKQDKRSKINFPRPSDTVWNTINSEINATLSEKLPKQKLTHLDVDQAAEMFDDFLADFFTEKFGTVDPPPNKPSRHRKKRKCKELENFRKRKNMCKKAYRTLVNRGLKDSKVTAIIRTRYRDLVKKHNKCRVKLARENQVKARKAAERSFKNDPNRFAQSVFTGPSTPLGPTFSQKEADEYFPKTYSDPKRGRSYTPLEGMPPKQVPTSPMRFVCPTPAALQRSARRKRNKAAPGLNGVSYVPFKKCPAIMLRFLWICKGCCKIQKNPALLGDRIHSDSS